MIPTTLNRSPERKRYPARGTDGSWRKGGVTSGGLELHRGRDVRLGQKVMEVGRASGRGDTTVRGSERGKWRIWLEEKEQAILGHETHMWM